MFVYNTIGFLFIHPLLINYYKSVGLQETLNHTKRKLAELIILRKEDVFSGKINFERIHQREFRLNESMYDILKEIHNDSLIYFYCINDKKEDSLEKEFHKKVEENSDNKNAQTNNNKTIKKLISEPPLYTILETVSEKRSKYKQQNIGKFLSVWEDVLTPPPQSFFS